MEPQVVYSLGQQWVLNAVLVFIMLGLALELKLQDFEQVINRPRIIITGLIAQFVLLPGLTAAAILYLPILIEMKMGMLLIACCPGGGFSNFFTRIAGGDVASSISLTALSSVIAVFMTPLNFLLYSEWVFQQSNKVELDGVAFAIQIFVILLVPLVVGMLCRHYFPERSGKVAHIIRNISVAIIGVFIVFSLQKNTGVIVDYIVVLLGIVVLHNAGALLIGYMCSTLAGLGRKQRIAVMIECGIQNAALGLMITLTFFDANTFMMMIVGTWAVWHLISGALIAFVFSRDTAVH